MLATTNSPTMSAKVYFVLDTVGSASTGMRMASDVSRAFQKEDEERSAYLSNLIKNGGKCRYCGTSVPDYRLEKSPGLCSKKRCLAKYRRGEPPREKEEMP